MSWTPERRARQAELIRKVKPWEKSTGPRTKEGKAIASQNARVHGRCSKKYLEERQRTMLVNRHMSRSLRAGSRVVTTSFVEDGVRYISSIRVLR